VYIKNEKTRQIFVNFIMPMIILAVRVEIEIIFKMNFRAFLTNKGQEDAAAEQ